MSAFSTRSPLQAWAALDEIARDGVNVVHAPRPLALDDELVPWLRAPGAPEGWEWSGDPVALSSEQLGALIAPLPARSRAIVRFDVAFLARLVAHHTRRRHVRVRFDVVRGDACRKFHQDFVALRLLVTYAGPGTEWVEDEHVDRDALGRIDLSVEQANASVVPDPSRVRRAAAGDALVLKGAAFPRNEGRGAVHRSPPLGADRACARLVLRIDVASCAC